MNLPDGFILEGGLIFWGVSLSKESLVSRGYEVELPNMAIASTGTVNQWHFQWMNFLAQVGEDLGVQIQWSVDSDYRRELAKHARITEEKAGDNKWLYFSRTERYERAMEAMQNGELRRERLRIYLSRKSNALPKKGLSTEQGLRQFIRQSIRNFDEKMDVLSRQVPGMNITPMTDMDCMEEMYRFLNPTMYLKPRSKNEQEQLFDLNRSIMDVCQNSDGIRTSDADGNVMFKMDDFYHTILVLKRFPQTTTPRLMNRVTNAIGLDYCITQNLLPLAVDKELKKESEQLKRLINELPRKPQLQVPVEKKQQKINELQRGFTLPYRTLTVIRVWDRTMEGLSEKCASLKTAVQSMNGAQVHQINHGGQGVNILAETLPGRTGGKVRQWDQYAENRYLADMLAVSSTFTGQLDEGEMIFDGDNGNLVGVATFNGSTPQHAVLVGMTGAGKSVFLTEVLSQVSALYEYVCIIEEGLSYGAFTETQGSRTIILHPDGDFTLNYFDTLGMPLSPLQIASASALCLKMVGNGEDQERNNYLGNIISAYISQLYTDAAVSWESEHDSMMPGIRRFAAAIENYRHDSMPPASTFQDSFAELRDMAATDPERFERINAAVGSEDAVVDFSKSSSGANLVRSLICAYFKPTEFPTHTALVESMQFGAMEQHEAKDVKYMATMLTAWKAGEGGKNGVLFDGHTNVSLTGKIVHFELGYIPESARALKEAAAFLIANFVRQHIITLPRGAKKCVIFEEVARFKNIPGGVEIVSEFYAQLRKYSCWVCSVIQQYGQLQGTALCATIFDNSRMFFLMRQGSQAEIDKLGDAVGLPDTARTAIGRFSLPDSKKKGVRRATSVLLCIKSGERMECGVIRNYPSPEMLYLADSGGEHFDQRRLALQQYPDIFYGIIEETAKLRREQEESLALVAV